MNHQKNLKLKQVVLNAKGLYCTLVFGKKKQKSLTFRLRKSAAISFSEQVETACSNSLSTSNMIDCYRVLKA